MHDPIVCQICDQARIHVLLCFFMMIVATAVIGFGVFMLYKLSVCYEHTMTTTKDLEKVEIFTLSRRLNDRDLFLAVLLCAACAFLLFHGICSPLMEHFHEVDEHFWMRKHISLMVITMVSFSAFISTYISTRKRVRLENIVNENNEEEAYHVATHMKLGWLILGSIMANIAMKFLFWLTV